MVPPELPYAELSASAHAQLDFMRDRIRTYVMAESPSGDPDALANCAKLLAAGHAEAGGRTSRDGEHLVTTWSGPSGRSGPPGPQHDAPHLLIVGHYDTVWPTGQLEKMPYRDDGTTIAGPGTYDMKAGLVIVEAAVRTLAELGIPLQRKVVLLVTSDEEIGSLDGRRLVERHSAGAHAVLGLEPPHPRGLLKTGRRGSTRVRITVTGREAHAALDRSKGVSAIDELLDQLAIVRESLPTDGSTLANIGTLEGGTRANVIAGVATAEVGLRFDLLEAEHRVLAMLQALAPIRTGATVDVRVLSSRPTWVASEQNPLLHKVIATGAKLGMAIDGRPAAGAGDTNFTGAAGIPTLDGFGPVGRGAHSLDESLEVASLSQRAALLAALLAGGL